MEEGKNMHHSDNIPVVLFLSEKLRNNLTTNKRPTVGVILDRKFCNQLKKLTFHDRFVLFNIRHVTKITCLL